MGIKDYTADLTSARLAALDVRKAELEAEIASIDKRREAYGAEPASEPAKKSRRAAAKD